MFLTSLRLSGKHFGELEKIRNVIYYRISPYEQKAFAGALSKGIPNIIRRFRENVFVMGVPFLLGYLVYDAVETEHKRLSRKNPADFEHEK